MVRLPRRKTSPKMSLSENRTNEARSGATLSPYLKYFGKTSNKIVIKLLNCQKVRKPENTSFDAIKNV